MTPSEKMGKTLENLLRGILLVHMILIIVFICSMVFIFLWGVILYWEYPDVKWSGNGYYLQQQVCGVWEREHNLFYKVNDKKELLLPQVYGYKKEGAFIYIAAVQGYAVINLQDGTSDIIMRTKDIYPINDVAISYHTSLLMLEEHTQNILINLPHKLSAYFFDKDHAKTVGDGRFQCMYLYDEDDNGSYSLEAYEPYANSWHDTLLPSLNAYRIEKKSQMIYAIAPQGYAIVDGLAGTCRIYFTDPELAAREYQKDIHVLESFTDFSPKEQKILKEVEEEGL